MPRQRTQNGGVEQGPDAFRADPSLPVDRKADRLERDRTIDFDLYLPTVVARLMRKLQASANEFFGRRYGLTLLEWRILSFLAGAGSASAYAIWTEAELDKAAVSRALRDLRARGLVTSDPVSGSKRRKSLIALSAGGRLLYDESFDEVLRRHDRLVESLSSSEIAAFLSTANRLEKQIPSMADADRVAKVTYRPVRHE